MVHLKLWHCYIWKSCFTAFLEAFTSVMLLRHLCASNSESVLFISGNSTLVVIREGQTQFMVALTAWKVERYKANINSFLKALCNHFQLCLCSVPSTWYCSQASGCYWQLWIMLPCEIHAASPWPYLYLFRFKEIRGGCLSLRGWMDWSWRWALLWYFLQEKRRIIEKLSTSSSSRGKIILSLSH